MRHLLRPTLFALSAFTGLFLPGANVLAQSCSKLSPPHRVALLELYTSEGCSSCPPADQFISGLRASGVTPEQAVVLSMHVDYWNDIGWKDPFSKALITARQRWLTSLTGSHTVYTPEIFMSGKELRGGVSGWQHSVAASVQQINRQPAGADIGLTLEPGNAGTLQVDIQAGSKEAGKLYLALLQDGIATEVRAGENAGVVLKHDFVVREWLGPFRVAGDGKAAQPLRQMLPLPANAARRQLGVAAFIQNDKGEILQALAMPVCQGIAAR